MSLKYEPSSERGLPGDITGSVLLDENVEALLEHLQRHTQHTHSVCVCVRERVCVSEWCGGYWVIGSVLLDEDVEALLKQLQRLLVLALYRRA